MKIKEALAVLKPGIETGPVFADEAAIVNRDGILITQNSNLQVWQEIDEKTSFAVVGSKLMKSVGSTPDAEFRVTEKTLTVKNKIKETRLPLVKDIIQLNPPEGEGKLIPDAIKKTLSQALNFTADVVSRPWSMGVLVKDGHFYATNDLVAVESNESYELDEFNGLTLPFHFLKWVIGFGQSWGIDDGGFWATNGEGGFCRAGKLAKQTPDDIPNGTKKMYQEPTWEIPTEWRESFLHIENDVSDAVRITETQAQSIQQLAEVEANLTAEQLGKFNVNFTMSEIVKVVKLSTHINLAAEGAIPFKGEQLHGVIAPRAE